MGQVYDDADVPYQDPRGRKVNVTLEELQTLLNQSKGQQGNQQLVMQRGGEVVEGQPSHPQRRLTPQEQREIFLRAQQENQYGRMISNPEGDDGPLSGLNQWNPSNPLQGISQEEVDERRRERELILEKAKAEREAKQIQVRRDKGDFSDELSSFLSSSEVYQELKTKMPKKGAHVYVKGGAGRVLAQDVLTQRVLVASEDGAQQYVPLDEIQQEAPKEKGRGGGKPSRPRKGDRGQRPRKSKDDGKSRR